MRKIFLFFGFITLLYFSFGFYFANYELQLFSLKSRENSHPYYYDYRGVTHVVTSYSKGSSTPPNILLEAAEANLSFLFFTDLNLMKQPYNVQGYNGDVFTFSNQKLSYLDSHILVYTDAVNFTFDSLSTANAQLSQHFSEPPGKEKDFLAVLAHPFKRNHRWTGEYPIGLDGIEVVNMRHLWQQVWLEDKVTFAWSIFTYPFNPQLALLRLIKEPSKELELWDALNKNSRTLGFLGNETTAKIFNILGLNFTFPSYEKSFNFASNHILLESELTGHVETDREKIFSSIKKGHFYFSFDSLGSPKGFAAFLEGGNQRYLIGDQLKLIPGLQLKIDLPEGLQVPFRVEVYKDGGLYFKSNDVKTTLQIKESGNYRVVVKIQPKLPLPDRERWFGWVYTNPFFIQP